MNEQDSIILREQQGAKSTSLGSGEILDIKKIPPKLRLRIFSFSIIPLQIVIFAFVGWIVGPYFFGYDGDILGMLVGTMVGTVSMFLTLFIKAGVFER